MNIQEIDKWLDNEYGVSYTRLEELHDFVIKQDLKHREEAEKEIERLNKLISQREKKWEKWTTEKTILSTKMSDYLCKYQNLKREYTKQIKISTDRKKEIERLNNIINEAKIYCEDVIQEHENGEYDVDTVWLAIKEHKGNIKSVLNMLNGDLENYWRSDKE